PAQLPLLLLNGCSGIAVGMATSIPPHNLGEVVDGLIGLINQPDLPDQELFKLIPGPDFPTGGEILNSDGIVQAYQTGRGLIPVRGMSHIETIKGEKKRSLNRTAIVITELPFQVNKAAWIEKIASLVNDNKLEGISDLRDESDRTGMRVVIELKRDTNPSDILEKLHKMTPLQSNFGVIFLALVNNQPVQMSLRRILEEFLQFREATLMRQYDHELGEASHRLELLDGLLTGLDNLDTLIDILRLAPDGTSAKVQLQERLGITPTQGDAILGMPLRRITGLEQEKLQQERQALADRIQALTTLLGDRHQRLKVLKKELRSLKKKFGDDRRTRILQGMPPNIIPIPPEPAPDNNIDSRPIAAPSPALRVESARVGQGSSPLSSLTTTAAVPPAPSSPPQSPQIPDNLPVQLPSPPPPQNPLTLFTPQVPPANAWLSITLSGAIAWHEAMLTVDTNEGLISQQFPLQHHQTLVIITEQGKAYAIQVEDIPPLALARVPLWNLLPKSVQRDADKIIFQGFVPGDTNGADLVLVTKDGRIKRLASTELKHIGNRGLSLIKLRDGDRLQLVHWCQAQPPHHNLVIATSNGRLLRFPGDHTTLPYSSRSSQGQPALRVRSTEKLVGLLAIPPTDSLLLLTTGGYGKRLPLNTIRLANFGDLGTTVIQFTDPKDQLLAMRPASATALTIISNQHNIHVIQAEQFKEWHKDGPGDLLVELAAQESLEIVS
ncbi:MAG: gyrase subunit, partial [Cyanobacteriota bacterium]